MSEFQTCVSFDEGLIYDNRVLKGRRFKDIQTIQKNVTVVLKDILETDFKHAVELSA